MNPAMRRTAVLLLTAVTLSACGLPPMISDTGYRGTWSRGNDRNVSIVSIVSIVERDGRFLFRWTKRSFDGKLTVLCDWDGRCEKQLNGTLVATYAIVTRYDTQKGELATDTIEKRVLPDEQTSCYTDVMDVKDGGRTLWIYTTDRDGQHYEGLGRPMRSFTKVANSVAGPPRVGP